MLYVACKLRMINFPLFFLVGGVLESRLGSWIDHVIGERLGMGIGIGCHVDGFAIYCKVGCISNLNPHLMQMEAAEGESVVN